MFERDEYGFPSYWTLQIFGWIALFLLILVCILPYINKPGNLEGNAISILAMVAATFFLRPVCRRLWQRESSWLALESWAFLWCVPAGLISGFVCEAAVSGLHTKMDWAECLVSGLQNTVVLFLWCSLYFSVKQWQQSTRERERLLRAEAEVRDARLSALRYQLNPHFLFNSLNAVSTLILEGDAPAATRMLAQIGELLRSSLNGEVVAEIPLAQEIAFTERYLAIEQTRLGRRLRIEILIHSDTLDAMVPSMLLQPLVENAVRHGVAPLVDGGKLRIASQLRGDRLRLVVRNTGNRDTSPGRECPSLEDLSIKGIGLRNTAERLKTLYPSDHNFALQWLEAGGCEVTVEIPLRHAPRELTEPEAVLCAR